jgi:hypothetical protein
MRVSALLEGNQLHWLSFPPKLNYPIQVVIEIPDDVELKSDVSLEKPDSDAFLDAMDCLLGTIHLTDQDQLMKERHFQEELQHELSFRR